MLAALAVLVDVLREADYVLEVGHLAFALVVQGEAALVRGSGIYNGGGNIAEEMLL